MPKRRRTLEIVIAEEIVAIAAQARAKVSEAAVAAHRAAIVEDSLSSLIQPTIPPIPAHELYGSLLFEDKHYSEARREYMLALKRTPRRASTLLGLAKSCRAAGEAANLFSQCAQIRARGDDARQPSAARQVRRAVS
jgi:hypothetical protein